MSAKRCLCRGEFVSARVVGGVIEIFNRKNKIVCIVPFARSRFYRSIARLIVMSLDEGVYNIEVSRKVSNFFPSYKNDSNDDEYYSFNQARRNWPKFHSPFDGVQENCGRCISRRKERIARPQFSRNVA